jgi:hypothetical protein
MLRKVGIVAIGIVLAVVIVAAVKTTIFNEKLIIATEASTSLKMFELQPKADRNLPETHGDAF